MLQIATTTAVVLFALLMVTADHPLRIAGMRLLPTLIGITGLAFAAIGLLSIDAFHRDWAQSHSDTGGEQTVNASDLLPVLFEIGLWALGVLYVVRLIEIARG